MDKLEKEYQQALWPSPGRELFSAQSRGTETGVHFMNAGSVCIFQLCPVVSFDTTCSADNLTITEAQFSNLENILRNGSVTKISSLSSSQREGTYRAPKQVLLTSIILMSPIQLLDPVDDGASGETAAHTSYISRRIRYADGVSQRLLDLLADWVLGKFTVSSEDDVGPEGKEVVFVCPTSGHGLNMRVRCYNLDDMVLQRGADVAEPPKRSEFYPASTFLRYQPAVTFKQLCCGPSVGIPLKSGNVDVGRDTSTTGGVEEKVSETLRGGEASPKALIDASMGSRFPLYSPSGKVFVCTVDISITEPHCGLLVVGGDVKSRRHALKEVTGLATLSVKDRGYQSSRSNLSSRRDSFDNGPADREQDYKLELRFSADTTLLTLDSFQQLASYLSITDERRVPPNVKDVWLVVCELLKPKSVRGDEDESGQEDYCARVIAAPASIMLSEDAKILDLAVLEICKRCEKLIANCFRMNQESLFGGGVLSGQGVGGDRKSLGGTCSPGILSMMLSIVDWLLNEMPPSYRAIFPPPSPLLMKWFWHFFSMNMCVDVVSAVRYDKKSVISPSEMVLVALRQDYTLFSLLCTGALRCSALFVLVAGHNGLSQI